MSEGERPNQPQRHCTNCGAEIRQDTLFCVSCGKQIEQTDVHAESSAPPEVGVSGTRQTNLPSQQEIRLVSLIVGTLLFLIVTYLLLSYSTLLGSLLIVLLALAVLIIRKNRGSQSVPEQRLFEAVGWYGQSARSAYEQGRHRELAQNAYQQSRRAYEEANTRYQRWNEQQAAERERKEALQRIEWERNECRVRFDRYRRFFERAHEGTRQSLDWWRAYDTGEFDSEGSTVADVLLSAQDRAQRGLNRLREMEDTFFAVLEQQGFDKADVLLDGIRAGQENFEGEESVFPPLVEVHERVKSLSEWAHYRQELEKLVKDLEDLLGSPNVRTVPASRVRFPDPGGAKLDQDTVRHTAKLPARSESSAGHGGDEPPKKLTESDLDAQLGHGTSGRTVTNLVTLVSREADKLVNEGYWGKSEPVGKSISDDVMKFLVLLAHADEKIDERELRIIYDYMKGNLDYFQIKTFVESRTTRVEAALNAMHIPDYFRVLVAYDRDNGTDSSALVLRCMSEIGRHMVLADNDIDEREVAKLTARVAWLRNFMLSEGVSADYKSESSVMGVGSEHDRQGEAREPTADSYPGGRMVSEAKAYFPFNDSDIHHDKYKERASEDDLDKLLGKSIPDANVEDLVKVIVVVANKPIEDRQSPQSASINESVARHIFHLLVRLIHSSGEIGESEAEIVRTYFSLGGNAPTRDEIKLALRRGVWHSDAAASMLEVPDYIEALTAHDKDNDTNYTALVLRCLTELGRQVISSDSYVDEDEVAALTKHINHLRRYIESQGISSQYESKPHLGGDVVEPNEQIKVQEQGTAAQEVPSIDELLAKLHRLVGLPEVKQEVETLINLIRVRQERIKRRLPVPPISFHLVFTGNPGTGKTTVARQLASIYQSLGLLSKGHLKEVDRSGLVAAYMGQTAIKVQEVVKEALGGILFVDEAYALVSGRHETDYGREAVDTLLKLMEDHRDDLVVIVAGYPEKMGEFLRSNPGLQSRFNRFIHFEDYSPEEMWEIFKRVGEDYGYRFTPAAAEHVRSMLGEMHAKRDENFGNARDVRNLFEHAVSNHANRLAAVSTASEEQLSTLDRSDFLPFGRA